jgi:hypothetical protein
MIQRNVIDSAQPNTVSIALQKGIGSAPGVI